MTAFIKTLKTVQLRKQLSFEKILAEIKDGSLFGFVLCDIHTPGTLKKLFEELPPMFKNVEASREDIGDHMRNYAEQKKNFKKTDNAADWELFWEGSADQHSFSKMVFKHWPGDYTNPRIYSISSRKMFSKLS